MRQSNQRQYQKLSIMKTPKQNTNITTSSQFNTYQKQLNTPKSSQEGTQNISEKGIQPSDLSRTNVSLSNKPITQTVNYSMNARQGNQRYNTQSQNIPRIEKKIYVNQGKGNHDGYRIKPITINKTNERYGLSSLISSGESYSSQANVNKSRGDFNNRKENDSGGTTMKTSKVKITDKRDNLRERKKIRDESNSDHNRAKSYITHRNQTNKLAPPKNTVKSNHARSMEVKRKTIYRGGKYNNIQITHIISTTKENIDKYNFHIFEKLSRVELDKKPLDLSKIGSLIKDNKKAKSTFRSSCDTQKSLPKSKEKIQKTTIFQHAAGIGMTNLPQNMISSTLYKSGILPLPKRKRPKGPPIVQVIESFRSQQPNSSFFRNNNKSIGEKYNSNYSNTNYLTNVPPSSQRMNKSITSNNLISRNRGIQQQKPIIVKDLESNQLNQQRNTNKTNNITSFYNNITNNKNKYTNTINSIKKIMFV